MQLSKSIALVNSIWVLARQLSITPMDGASAALGRVVLYRSSRIPDPDSRF